MKKTIIRDVLKHKAITGLADEPVISIIEKLRSRTIGAVPITDEKSFPTGIITQADILDAFLRHKEQMLTLKARDIMTSPVITLNLDEDLESAALIMSSNRIRRIPVVNKGCLVGILSYRDLTEDLRKSYYMLDELIQDKANKDPLTGLFNKGYAFDQLKQQFEMQKKISNPLFITIYDIDHFKKINDTYGHQCGDKVLKTISQVIKTMARPIDIVSRYGGEEFMISGFTADKGSVISMAETTRKSIEESSFMYNGRPIRATISAGISVSADKNGSHEDLFVMADRALYEAKKSGRNRVNISV